VTRLLVDWDAFKRALDEMIKDEALRRKLEAAIGSDPALAAGAAMLRSLWTPVERDIKELR
jgi:hypothetical protein